MPPASGLEGGHAHGPFFMAFMALFHGPHGPPSWPILGAAPLGSRLIIQA